jgi:hypothetical protein
MQQLFDDFLPAQEQESFRDTATSTLTRERVRALPGFETATDAEAEDVLSTIRQLAEILVKVAA